MKEVNISEVWRKKYPERVVVAASWDEKNNRPNFIPLGWFMQTSFSPPLVAISVGVTRYSHTLLHKEKEFVVFFPNKKMGKEVYYWGTHSGKDVDKLKESAVETEQAKHVKPPLIKNAPINLECKVVDTLRTGDHTIFVGKILAAYIEEEEEVILNFGEYKFGGIKEQEILFAP